MSRPHIWNIEQEKDRDKEKVGGRPAKLNEEKKQRRHFLLEGQHENFAAQVTNFPRETFFPLNQKKKAFKNDLDYTETEQTRETIQVMRSLNKVYTPS